MAAIGSKHNRLYVDFRVNGKRYKEYLSIPDTPANRKKVAVVMKRMEAEITLQIFSYRKYFPESSNANLFEDRQKCQTVKLISAESFRSFAEKWFELKRIEWRASHEETIRAVLDIYLLPRFGDRAITAITKEDLLSFRSSLGDLPGKREGEMLSPSRINHIMAPLRMILSEAAEKFNFTSPWKNIKPLREPKTNVEPFTLEEVQLILERVRADFRNYFAIRFFTGMRSSEINGLQWRYVDFDRRQILIRQAFVKGELVATKTDGSEREIDMNSVVFKALQTQRKAMKGKSDFVFASRAGSPINNQNMTRRVWYPLLRHLGLRPRRPYQTRHTAATLWLAAGENPEWIARQMGHASTQMLFRVYSRYIPNLTRKDGSALERLIASHISLDTHDKD
ncbi:MAG: tyrosine-type recombinase/integrase [Pseudomonadota bacterium]